VLMPRGRIQGVLNLTAERPEGIKEAVRVTKRCITG